MFNDPRFCWGCAKYVQGTKSSLCVDCYYAVLILRGGAMAVSLTFDGVQYQTMVNPANSPTDVARQVLAVHVLMQLLQSKNKEHGQQEK